MGAIAPNQSAYPPQAVLPMPSFLMPTPPATPIPSPISISEPPPVNAPISQEQPLPADAYTPSAQGAPGSEKPEQTLSQPAPQKPGKLTLQLRKPEGFLAPLPPELEIPADLKENLNPLQRMGVSMIENGYQRIAIKQDLFKQMSDQGLDICAFSRRGKQQGIKDWEGCSQYTKMSIVYNGFFKGCWKGLVRVMSCNPILFNLHTDWAERFIERQGKALPKKETAEKENV